MTTGSPQLDTVILDTTSLDAYKSPINGIYFEINSTVDTGPIRTGFVNLTKAVESELGNISASVIGTPITIQRGESVATEEYVFRGEVVGFRQMGGRIKLITADNLYQTTKREVTTSYDKDISDEQGVFSEIFKDLVNTYTSLTADNTSVVNSGTVQTVTKFICRGTSVYEALKRLADTIGWIFYYNPITDKVHFEPKGTQTQDTIITAANLSSIPNWETDSEGLFNKIKVFGALQEVETTVNGQLGVTEGYTTTDVTLPNTPQSTKVYSDSSNPPTTLLAGGIKGSTESFDYYVDKEQKKIIWNDSYTPGGSDYAKVDFSYFIPVPVVVQDTDSMDAFTNSEPREIVLHKYDIVNIDDAETYANQYLDDHKDPIEKSTLKVLDIKDLRVFQTVPVNDVWNDKDANYQIQSVTIRGPYRSDEVKVISKIIDEENYAYNVQQRIKRLEEEQTGDIDVLLQIFRIDRTTPYERRYAYKESRDLSSDPSGLFQLGSYLYGLLGTSELGDTIAWSTVELMQGNNTYKEFWYDDEFFDSGLSSGSLNTSTNTVTLGGGQFMITNKLWLGMDFDTSVLALGDVSNGTNLEVSLSKDDGLTWEVIIAGTTSLVNVGISGIRLKLQNNGTASGMVLPVFMPPTFAIGGTVTIKPTYSIDGSFDAPAVSLELKDA